MNKSKMKNKALTNQEVVFRKAQVLQDLILEIQQTKKQHCPVSVDLLLDHPSIRAKHLRKTY